MRDHDGEEQDGAARIALRLEATPGAPPRVEDRGGAFDALHHAGITGRSNKFRSSESTSKNSMSKALPSPVTSGSLPELVTPSGNGKATYRYYRLPTSPVTGRDPERLSDCLEVHARCMLKVYDRAYISLVREKYLGELLKADAESRPWHPRASILAEAWQVFGATRVNVS